MAPTADGASASAKPASDFDIDSWLEEISSKSAAAPTATVTSTKKVAAKPAATNTSRSKKSATAAKPVKKAAAKRGTTAKGRAR